MRSPRSYAWSSSAIRNALRRALRVGTNVPVVAYVPFQPCPLRVGTKVPLVAYVPSQPCQVSPSLRIFKQMDSRPPRKDEASYRVETEQQPHQEPFFTPQQWHAHDVHVFGGNHPLASSQIELQAEAEVALSLAQLARVAHIIPTQDLVSHC